MPDPALNSQIGVAVLASGRGSNLNALLEAKAAGWLQQVRFVAVVSDAPNPPAFDHARRHGIPTFHANPAAFRTKKDYESRILEIVRSTATDWIVLAGYMRIVGPTLLAAYAGKIINIHPSLLPAFPGLHAQRQAVEHGAKVSGCTVHFVDAGMDTGPIILQKEVPCFADDSEESLSARILEQEHKALPEALELISQGKVRLEGRKVIHAP